MFRFIFTILGAFIIAILTFFYAETIKAKEEADILISGCPLDQNSPPCLQMYYNIEKYAEKYNIPVNYAYGIAYKETGYKGAFDWKYRPEKTSSAGAVGPMQIIPSTAAYIWGKRIDKKELKNNIELNIETSMKYLAYLQKRYKNWKIVFGYYNTGYPIINQYAIDVYNFKTN